MFPRAYFSGRFFAPRYYPGGFVVPPPAGGAQSDGSGKPIALHPASIDLMRRKSRERKDREEKRRLRRRRAVLALTLVLMDDD